MFDSPRVAAFVIAGGAHAGQVDKAGVPYFQHALRVARAVAKVDPSAEAFQAAILHDVIEDSAWTRVGLLAAGIPLVVVEAVDALTRRPREAAPAYYARVRANPLALLVKEWDIADNADPVRLRRLAPEVRARLEGKYRQARKDLGLTGVQRRSRVIR